MSPGTVTVGYLFATVQKINGVWQFDIGDRLPLATIGGTFTIVVSNPSDEPVLVAVFNLSSNGPVPARLIQPANVAGNSSYVQMNPHSKVTFVVSTGGTDSETQRCTFSLVAAPAPVLMSLSTCDIQVDPWQG